VDYLARSAERKLKDMAGYFKVVLVVGARQVGKSTLVRHAFPGVRDFTFDPDQDLFRAKADPDLFLDNFRSPLILDEIQFAAQLLPAIKRRVDQNDLPGQYILTGSQNPMVLKQVSETMAGRVGILQVEGLSLTELTGQMDRPSWLEAWLSNPEGFRQDWRADPPSQTLAEALWRGSLPALAGFPDHLVVDYLRSYVQTYLERDVRTMSNPDSLEDFRRFLGLSAALTAQEVNDSQLGRELGVSPPTARQWRQTLIHTYQWRELPAYCGNTVKRVSGRRKGHVTDTGLACWLQLVSSPEALAVNPRFGAFFESFVVGAVHKEFVRLRMAPAVYHWRTAGGAEVDLVLELDGKLFPVEVKTSSFVSAKALSGLKAFRETYPRSTGPGLVIYAGKAIFAPVRDVTALPWHCL